MNFISWLDTKALNFNNGSFEYWVDLISTAKDTNRYIEYYYPDSDDKTDNPCYEKYSTTQSITVRLNKTTEAAAITQSLVQSFYDEVCITIYGH